MDLEIITTDDGSMSLFVKELNESYHSRFGAINESLHVYIRSGLIPAIDGLSIINLLEIGFGTGLNAFLTLLECKETALQVNYYTIEPFPLKESIFSKLNYPSILHKQELQNLFLKMHHCKPDEFSMIDKNFNLFKINDKIESISLKDDFFHLVYFDAFAPDIQPELWGMDIFQKLYTSMKKDGIMATYSAKGSVRRAMQEAGFIVERLAGPKGKREILRATKS